MVAPEGFEPPTFWFVASTEDFYPVYGLHILQNEQLKTYNFGNLFLEKVLTISPVLVIIALLLKNSADVTP